MGRHPVAVVQYTFTHIKYTEQHNRQKKHRPTQFKGYLRVKWYQALKHKRKGTNITRASHIVELHVHWSSCCFIAVRISTQFWSLHTRNSVENRRYMNCMLYTESPSDTRTGNTVSVYVSSTLLWLNSCLHSRFQFKQFVFVRNT